MTDNRSRVAVGFSYFAAIMMIVVGAFDAFQGLAAVIKKDYYVVGANYLWKLNVTGWGWIHLILGVLTLLAGIALLGGAMWARIVGVVLASLVAISNFLWLPYYPIWSVVIIGVCITVIWALTAHGREIAD